MPKCAIPSPSASTSQSPDQSPKPLFTVHAYSVEQARAIDADKVAGETIIVAVSLEAHRIPDTKHGLPAMACVSAMQKAIRGDIARGDGSSHAS